jgi:hypothetical protein
MVVAHASCEIKSEKMYERESCKWGRGTGRQASGDTAQQHARTFE